MAAPQKTSLTIPQLTHHHRGHSPWRWKSAADPAGTQKQTPTKRAYKTNHSRIHPTSVPLDHSTDRISPEGREAICRDSQRAGTAEMQQSIFRKNLCYPQLKSSFSVLQQPFLEFWQTAMYLRWHIPESTIESPWGYSQHLPIGYPRHVLPSNFAQTANPQGREVVQSDDFFRTLLITQMLRATHVSTPFGFLFWRSLRRALQLDLKNKFFVSPGKFLVFLLKSDYDSPCGVSGVPDEFNTAYFTSPSSVFPRVLQ